MGDVGRAIVTGGNPGRVVGASKTSLGARVSSISIFAEGKSCLFPSKITP
jgi:hypothetical protein